MKKLWLNELRRLATELDTRFQRREILKDTPFAHIVVALIKLVGVGRCPAVDPKAETVKRLAEAACCSDMHIAFVCSTDEQAFQRVISSLKLIVDHLKNSPKEILAV